MRGLLRVFGSVLCFLVVVSCTTGTKFSELLPSTKPTSAEVGRIFFYKRSSLGTAARPKVLLNGEKVGEVKAYSFFYLDRPPGEYEVTTSTDGGRKVSFVLEQGQTRYIRFSSSLGLLAGHVYGELVDETVALSEIQNCHYTGAKTAAK